MFLDFYLLLIDAFQLRLWLHLHAVMQYVAPLRTHVIRYVDSNHLLFVVCFIVLISGVWYLLCGSSAFNMIISLHY